MKKLREYKEKINYSFFDPKTLLKMKEETRIIGDLWEEQRPSNLFDFPSESLSENSESMEIPRLSGQSMSESAQLFLNRRSYPLPEFDSTWSKEELFTWISLSFGVSSKKDIPYVDKKGAIQQKKLKVRTYPSGGSMFSVDIYLYITNIEEVTDGLYKFKGEHHVLERKREKVELDCLHSLSPLTIPQNVYGESFNNTNILTFLVANYDRAFEKYGLLTERLAALEAGHIGQNIQLSCTMLGKKSLPMCAFYDDKVEAFLSLENEMTRCIYMVALG
ncbi:MULTISPECIES: SagB family peptide dehydrogenase [Sutcliffiella]|uniref:Nitroreductase domain-containing protein n=1 Tax=Sutcliffiella cohnii TaxID=33932 RepID=A0A223KVK6_9BACI|nr:MULTISPECIES: SagB family peptide dehydrogenase [Sutcliffiella]AST93512.1 hypothetical protein BC6307_20685 [Sutcliffiella cohnii]MED4014590.1 SagB family peptide dehydrogenase [Sutcliffiella cohnii]WBL14696.1 SagB family peptide dehydrogenase [Sutcliffiella sp. NC1]